MEATNRFKNTRQLSSLEKIIGLKPIRVCLRNSQAIEHSGLFDETVENCEEIGFELTKKILVETPDEEGHTHSNISLKNLTVMLQNLNHDWIDIVV
jgi:hypothetical protein